MKVYQIGSLPEELQDFAIRIIEVKMASHRSPPRIKGTLWCGHPKIAEMHDEEEGVHYCGVCSGELRIEYTKIEPAEKSTDDNNPKLSLVAK